MDSHIKETENKFYRIVEGANVLILYLDSGGNISICNRKIEGVTGKKKENVIGKNWLQVLYNNEAGEIKHQMFKAVMDDSITYKRPNSFEGVITDITKGERLICWNMTPILKESQELEGILLVGEDVTELKEREASLKKIDETLKNIFASVREYALYVANLEGKITYYGMGSDVMFGWQKNEVIFKDVSVLHSQEDAKSMLPFIFDRVKSHGQYETEIELVKKDGQRFPVSLTVSQFIDPDGKLTGYIFMAKDVTEKKKLEYQVFQAEKLAAIGQLAAGMAHEINNPLFVIAGRLEIILGQKRLAKKMKETLEIVNAQTDRIRKLVDRLLKFARKVPPKLESLNVNEIIDGVLPLLSYHKLPAANIEIERDLDKDLPAIKGDLNQLQEVFVNLLINAYQAMPQGGKITIKTANAGDGFARVEISDTGHGINEQHLRNIFMPFFSTKKEGTGLGLSICYNIIKSHNGSIDIESQPNRGTTFSIKLPFA